MALRLLTFLVLQLLVGLVVAENASDIKYPKNEFNSNDLNTPVPLELKKEIKKDIKKEVVSSPVPVSTESSNLLKLVPLKDVQKDAPKDAKRDALPQRDNSKATSQKDDYKFDSKLDSKLDSKFDSKPPTKPSLVGGKDKENVHSANLNNKDTVKKDQPISTSDELADLLIGTITNAKMADFRPNATSSSSKQANSTSGGTGSVLDDLRIKVIEQVHLKARIFFQALTASPLLRETATSIKNKNDGISKLSNSIYSSIPYLRPFQANSRPPANSNSWCGSLSSSFTQYSQLNAFLVAAFLLFPVVIPFYLFGWLTLFLLRAGFCMGAKQLVTSIVYRIRSS